MRHVENFAEIKMHQAGFGNFGHKLKVGIVEEYLIRGLKLERVLKLGS